MRFPLAVTKASGFSWPALPSARSVIMFAAKLETEGMGNRGCFIFSPFCGRNAFLLSEKSLPSPLPRSPRLFQCSAVIGETRAACCSTVVATALSVTIAQVHTEVKFSETAQWKLALRGALHIQQHTIVTLQTFRSTSVRSKCHTLNR